MNELDLLMNLHINNKRQGPGGNYETRLALSLSTINTYQPLKIADIGCGTGAQTKILAQELKGEIIAIDLFKEFLTKLKQDLSKVKVTAQVFTLQTSMDSLPFEKESLDLIWSEGAIYNIGFKKGIYYWKDFLKPNGILAVSEITWTTQQRPEEITRFWENDYPEIDTASNKIKVLEEAGFQVLGFFILPESCWIDNYYKPLQANQDNFLKVYGHLPEAQALIEHDKKEFELYMKYKNYYSYGFYIAKKVS